MKLADLYKRELEKRTPLKTFKVKASHCHPDTGEYDFYEVELWEDGDMNCSCTAGFYRKKCRHQQEILDGMAETFGGLVGGIEHFKKQRSEEKN